jgi:hypothetical protein
MFARPGRSFWTSSTHGVALLLHRTLRVRVGAGARGAMQALANAWAADIDAAGRVVKQGAKKRARGCRRLCILVLQN